MGMNRKSASVSLIATAGCLCASAALAGGNGAIDNFETGDGVVTPGEDYAAKVEVLGTAIEASQYDMPVTLRVMIGSESYDPFGGLSSPVGGNLNDDGEHAYVLPSEYRAGTDIRLAASSWLKRSSRYSGEEESHWRTHLNVSDSEDSQQVIVLRDGDNVPDIDPFEDQATIVSFLTDYIDADTGKISIESHQAIYLFELGTTNMSSGLADFQDLVVMVSLAQDREFFASRSALAPQPGDMYD